MFAGIYGESTFHKGLLVGSDSRKNLTRVLLVSRDMCQIFFCTLYGFSWSSGVKKFFQIFFLFFFYKILMQIDTVNGQKASAHWTERPQISAT